MKYKIAMVRLDNFFAKGMELDKFLEEVEGEPFTVPGWEEIKLAKRRVSPDSAYDESFTVDELETGYRVGDTYLTDAQAIKDLSRRFEGKGIEAIRQIIAERRISNVSIQEQAQ